MRGLRHPVGPEPAGIYWGRRIMVILIAVLVVVVMIIGIRHVWPTSNNDDSQSTNTAATTTENDNNQSQTDQSAAAQTPVVTDTQLPQTPSATATPTPTPTPTGPAKCTAADLKMSIKGPSRTKINSNTTLSVGWTNATQETCIFNPSDPKFELKIYSGTDRIWSSLDCPAGIPVGDITMVSATPLTFDVVWNGQRSSAGCKLANNLRPGTYVATAVVEGGTPVRQVMVLSR